MICPRFSQNLFWRSTLEILNSSQKIGTVRMSTDSCKLVCESKREAKCPLLKKLPHSPNNDFHIFIRTISNRNLHQKILNQIELRDVSRSKFSSHRYFHSGFCDSLTPGLFNKHQCCQVHRTSTLHSLFSNPDILSSQVNRIQNQQCRNFSLSPKYIMDSSPTSIQPYLRLVRFDKPIGTWLLYWPCTWSIALAASPGCLPDLWLLTLFGMGSFFMRGAGCIINDMWDKDYDKMVERTKLRPLASGELTQFQGLLCLGGMLSVSLGILLQLNVYSILLGASSMLLVIMYPLAKRYTYWPQAMLGITLNWGVLLAWSALHGCLEWPAIPLYIACVFYTMTYDSIYAHQDKYDDMLIGVKSTALKFGDKTKPWLTGFATTMLSGLTLTGYMCEQTWPYYTGVALTAAHLFHQIYTVDLNNADDCAKKFRSNSGIGLLLFLATVAGTLLKKDNKDDEEVSKTTSKKC